MLEDLTLQYLVGNQRHSESVRHLFDTASEIYIFFSLKGLTAVFSDGCSTATADCFCIFTLMLLTCLFFELSASVFFFHKSLSAGLDLHMQLLAIWLQQQCLQGQKQTACQLLFTRSSLNELSYDVPVSSPYPPLSPSPLPAAEARRATSCLHGNKQTPASSALSSDQWKGLLLWFIFSWSVLIK